MISNTVSKTTNPSVVDYLTSKGQASDYNSRTKLAQQYGIQNYTGTAEQNTSLLKSLQTPTSTSTSTPTTSWSNLTSGATPLSSLYTAPKTGTQTSTAPTAGLVTPNLPQAQSQPQTTWSNLTSGATPVSSLYGGSTSTPTSTGTQKGLIAPPAQSQMQTTQPLQTPTQPEQPQQQTSMPVQQPQYQDLSRGGIMEGLTGMAQDTSRIDAVNQKIADLRASLADKTAAINSEGIPLEFKQGKGNVLANQANAKEVALTGLLNAELQARGQSLGAYGTAAGLSQPVTGIQPGTQTLTYDTQGNPQVSAGSPFQAGQVAGEQSLGAQYAQNVSAHNQSVALKNQIVSFLNTTPVNPNDFTDINKVLAFINGKTSDPKYQQLSAQLNEYLQTLAPILGVGGDTSDYRTQLAQGLLNGRMSPQAIVQQLNTIEQTAKTKLEQQKLGGGYQQAQSQGDGLFNW